VVLLHIHYKSKVTGRKELKPNHLREEVILNGGPQYASWRKCYLRYTGVQFNSIRRNWLLSAVTSALKEIVEGKSNSREKLMNEVRFDQVLC
jgi:hypothetical protein